jgi:hypothetical protein
MDTAAQTATSNIKQGVFGSKPLLAEELKLERADFFPHTTHKQSVHTLMNIRIVELLPVLVDVVHGAFGCLRSGWFGLGISPVGAWRKEVTDLLNKSHQEYSI